MQTRYIAPAIMLTAGVITSIFNLINQVDLLDGIIKLFVILIIFYILGRIAAAIIERALKSKPIDSDIMENSTVSSNKEDESNKSGEA